MLLELDIATIIFEIVNFLVLAYLLNRFFFQPVMQRVRQRADEKARIRAQLDEDQAEVARLRQQLDQELAQIDQRADEVMSAAQERAENERAALLDSTRREADQMRREAEEDGEKIRQRAMIRSRDAVLDTALDVSGHVISRALTPDVHQALVSQIQARIWELGQTEMAQVDAIRQSLAHRAPTVSIMTACPLNPEDQNQLVQTLSALADRDVSLDVQTDPDLIGGLRIRVGDIIMDNTFAGKIEALRDETRALLQEEGTVDD